MFDWLMDFFTWIGDMLHSGVSLIGNLLGGFLDLLKSIPTILTFLTAGISNLPDIVLPFATAAITISVVLFVVGRQNNS